ncbi:response regulator [Sporosarcina sp. FA9]|uniref:response regulator n=1 Tax=Sporosarcina sp. FA9 TaxID=3413030 RepID=UPI003F659918
MANITVFIVEDDPMVLDINKGFLERMAGFSLVGFSMNGKDALAQIKILKPQLILLDMFLPDMSGIEILTKLRLERIPSDVIMITAARDTVTIQEVMRFGAVDYMVKPFRFERFQKSFDNYYKTTRKLKALEHLKQEDIDDWLGSASNGTELPKGLNKLTMEQIVLSLVEETLPITAEQLAQTVGMARVTVRKYLDFLAHKEKVRIEMQYGNVGRPTKFYSLL